MTLADELEKLAGEAHDPRGDHASRWSAVQSLKSTLQANLPAILSALREREAVQAVATFAAEMKPLDPEFRPRWVTMKPCTKAMM